MKTRLGLFLPLWLALAGGLRAEEAVDLEMITRIKQEGFDNSQVMETLGQLTDVFGPRLTGSPELKAASQWSRDKLSEWGLKESRLESWGTFGKGWSLEKFSASMTKPRFVPLIAMPKAWTSGVGKISGVPVLVDVENESDLERYKGKLQGAIVMLPARAGSDTDFEPDSRRLSDQDLAELAKAPEPGAGSDRQRRRAEYRRFAELRRKLSETLAQEGVRLVLESSRGDDGTLFVSGNRPPKEGEPAEIPSVVVSAEQFARIERLLKRKIEVQIDVELETRFYEDDLDGYNVIAEIPGSDPELRSQVVMLGAHIDSWHAGDGATDNASGVAVAMEAVRILKALGVEPRRTVRIGLWSGEEQGLLGSRGYVAKHLADSKTMALLPEHGDFSVYFNLDNGGGKIRGVYLQENDAARPIFEAYLTPFHDLGAATLAIRNTGGTDHLAFDAVGLPGFQFIQDPLDYSTRTHHTNMDLYDQVAPADLMQASVIMASFVYHASMRDGQFPRKPLPKAEESEERPAPAPPAAGLSR